MFLLIVQFSLSSRLYTTGPNLHTWIEDPGLCPVAAAAPTPLSREGYSALTAPRPPGCRSYFVSRTARRKGGRFYCRWKNLAFLVMILLLSGDLELSPGPSDEGRRGSAAVTADSSYSRSGLAWGSVQARQYAFRTPKCQESSPVCR